MKKVKYRILYVDDEEINLRVFKNTFEDEFEVYTAISGAEGIKIFQEHNIDLIITDQRMPEMSGIEFLKRIIDMNPEPNRILLTGFSDIDALSSAVNEGKIYQYINKPWDEAELKPVIYQALESYYIKRENQKLTIALKEKAEALGTEIAEKNKLVDQLKQTLDELKIAKEKAEESDRLKTAFLNNLSHEIRTPLNGIIGFTNLLYEMNPTAEDKLNFVTIINRSGQQLLAIIDDILSIATIEAGQAELKMQELNIPECLEEMKNEYQGLIDEKDVSIHFNANIEPEQSFGLLDESKFRRILRNLLDNAVKFTDKGSIDINCEVRNDIISFTIKDTGIGIAEENHKKIFDRFMQINGGRNRVYQGNGLGLTIAKAYVELMGGKISVESTLGKGAKFSFAIPFKTSTLRSQKAEEKTNTGIPNLKSKTILVAEDELSNYLLVEMILRPTNANLIHVTNGKEAVELCKNNPAIDLVLMDIKMPVMNGLMATKIIKQQNHLLPVIALTAYAQTGDRELALNNGCDEHLPKPITKKELLHAIGRYI